ncbi:putative baseplate assembly protein [Phormidium sp. LEGE 05292]|uniref:putative baseplate assembly protein n=1 Tax=[Phormidium] sp. LEGE 05292 TaxID=767427 RepID=UPI001880175D|nr:putative baseplate assembly protein [Phormidium sp. LEGE 05292]MBE9225430.1 putative baseplate assembly protein [Phormidium sp. LEGE 05292]
MNFDFLPELPKSNLDDRTFNDLVEECILRIPRYCPEWTNHNPGDPGITLIELFAWLTDQMLLRFNQVPRRNYVAFLELLGIRLLPPAPAWCELTFYLSKAQSQAIVIPYSTEVATVRTETQEAVIFSTDRELIIGNPKIRHFLTAVTEEDTPQNLSDRTPTNNQWWNLEETLLFEQSSFNNCFYLVLTEEDLESPIIGNVIAITFKGEAARTTGINPDDPPLKWEAWNGSNWQSTILRQREDDKTRGFSFDRLAQQGTNSLNDGADVVLHLPQQWPIADFGTGYSGHWIRCVYTRPREIQPSYSSSPSIVGLAVRSIGGAVNASECVRIENELLGVSDGKPGQAFELQGKPVLERKEGECIAVKPINGGLEIWTEVADFADSTPDDRHYTIDSQTGVIQFGPLIREPAQIKQQTQQRSQIQPVGRIVRRDSREVRNLAIIQPSSLASEALERQYGKVPPPGSEIYMVAYRTGGGSRGNVQAEKLSVVKQAIPYIKNVINYEPAREGIDAESLDEAVIRVPQILRTRECAVTPEDFENVAKAASRTIARAHCITDPATATPGIVPLLIVPKVNTDTFSFRRGMNPDEYFTLNTQLSTEILKYMQDRKPLGVQVKLQEPEYVGVSVRTEVTIDPKYNNPRAQEEMRSTLLVNLYRFLNPLIGGVESKGWDLGRPLYTSDIIALCQKIPGVRYLGTVELFEIRKYGTNWFVTDEPQSIVNPGSLGLICSWADEGNGLQSGHVIELYL